jgi:hypothetical protein
LPDRHRRAQLITWARAVAAMVTAGTEYLVMGSKPQIPNTITDAKWAELSRRAQKHNPPMFSDEAVRRRLADAAQRRKANQS